MRKLSVAMLVLAMTSPGFAKPDINDTRLMSQPAVSKDHIAFVYAEDLWIANLDGNNVRRLTSDLGLESNPVFSPDGQTLAFTGQYDGNSDVYTIPITGGNPTRLTWHPAADLVRSFTTDGKGILFSSNRNVFSTRHSQLFIVPVQGGMPEQLPIPHGFEASFSPKGDFIAYCPQRDVTAQWKNYRGGTTSRIWIYNRSNHQVEQVPQPDERCNDSDPNWIGDLIYFRSDRDGEYNLYSYHTKTKVLKKLTNHTDFPILDIASGNGNIVYEQAGWLHRYEIESARSSRIRLGIATDLAEIRSRFVKGAKYVRGASVSPSGARAVVEFRGEIVTVPAEKGDPRNLTNTPGVHERDPAWSPDGKTIAWFSDATGEYELHLGSQDGKTKPRTIPLKGSGYYQNLGWSRDSKKLLFSDNSQSLYWIDAESGKQTKITTAEYGRLRGNNLSSWSHDSKWIAYSRENAAQISQVFLYSLEQNKSFPLTDGLSEAAEPVFDISGKYVYFISSNDTAMSKHGFSQSSADSRTPRWALNIALLKKDTPSPFLRETDEEKILQQPMSSPAEGKADNPSGEPKGPAKGNFGLKKNADPLQVDFDGIDHRILTMPIPQGIYSNLQAGLAGQLYYLSRADAGAGGRGGPGGPSGATLNRFDLEKKKSDTVQASVITYELTPDGRKMLYATNPTSWFIGSSSGGGAPPAAAPTTSGGRGFGGAGGAAASGAGGPQPLNLDAIEIKIDPELEWKQIVDEAWRINRDFFYAPNMHGADWPAIRKKYDQFLPHFTSGADVYRVIKWMLSELAVGHSYHTPGERLHERKTVSGGLLGADYDIANGRYRFKKIYGGASWSPDLRSPLTAPGVNVKEGEYLLAVKGVDLKPPTEIFSLFENTAGKTIEITVGPSADGKNARTVSIEPISNEYALRNREWVEGNLQKVHKATNGRVAYVYVPDTAAQGMVYFKRYFFPQIDKEAIIVDERFNGGGQIADYYIDILRRPFASYWAPRYGADWRSPSAAIHGPKVMIADEGAGSGGDMLPWMFRKFKLGPIVGKRTWGGLVGISGYPTLMDGGNVTAPSFAIWTPEDGYTVENQGVAPDIEVEQWPADVIAGRDPQLEKAIEIIMKELEKQPKKELKRPPLPVRTRTGEK